MEKSRNISLDWMRFIACALVILQHVTEYFYVSPDLTPNYCDNSIMVGMFNSISRVAVPLFVIISGYLLLPMNQPTTAFFKRRFTRILYPLLIWSLVYSVYIAYHSDSTVGDWLRSVCTIPFIYQVEHLWYVYMLIGLYLIIPILSPWLKSTSRRELEVYLCIWVVTSLLPYLRLWMPTIWADTYFNSSPMLYYFTGFGGYLLLGYYIRRYNPFKAWQAVLALVVGWVITSWIFLDRLTYAQSLQELELSWGFNTINILLMSMGTFVLLSHIKVSHISFIDNSIISISKYSYGIYLCHMLWLWLYLPMFMQMYSNVIVVALIVVPCTYISAYLTIFILSLFPKSKVLY